MRKAVIDRFEDDYVVVEWLDTKQSEAVPIRLMPSGAKMNDVLVQQNGSWTVDLQATKERAEQTEQLMNDLWKDA
jgi:hypothetical protein